MFTFRTLFSTSDETDTGNWEHYHNDYSKTLPAVIATSVASQPDGAAGAAKMAAPFTAVQLHPNYAFACQVSALPLTCVSFSSGQLDFSGKVHDGRALKSLRQ